MSVGALLLAMVTLLLGTSLAKSLFPAVGAEGVVFYRLAFAAALLVIIFRPWRLRASASRREWLLVAAYGAILGTMNLLFYLAIRTIPLGIAIAIEFIGPLSVATFHSRRAQDFFWVLLVVVGLGLLLPLGEASAALDPLGLLCAVGAGVCWGSYILVGQAATRRLPSTQVVAAGMVVAALVAAPFGAFSAGAKLLNPEYFVWGFAVAVLASAVPYSLEMYSLRRLPKRTFSILLSLEPAMGSLAGVVVLHEQLAFTQWLAIGCIVLAAVGSAATGRVRVGPVS